LHFIAAGELAAEQEAKDAKTILQTHSIARDIFAYGNNNPSSMEARLKKTRPYYI
jgi:hypothetical protein